MHNGRNSNSYNKLILYFIKLYLVRVLFSLLDIQLISKLSIEKSFANSFKIDI